MHLSLHGIQKRFGENLALKGVDLELAAGEAIGLVGENGAGKSTLTRIISGAHQPDAGVLSIDGQPVVFRGPRDAMARGVQAIYQEFKHNLFPQLTVAENIFVLDEAGRYGRGWVRRSRMFAQAAALMRDLGLQIDPRARLSDLGVGEQQMVEIAKALVARLEVLILDEPTAALDEAESRQLFTQVQRLREQGVSIIYVSHRLSEVFELTDRIVVLRDGVESLSGRTQELSPPQVVTAMVGRTIEDFYPKSDHLHDKAVLEVEHLSRHNSFADISFSVRAGEVLGIGGVVGCGRGPLLRALFGDLRLDSGRITLGGRELHLRGPADAVAAGIGFVVPDRQGQGLCLDQSIAANITLAGLDQFTRLGGSVDRRAERRAVEGVVAKLGVRARSIDAEVNELSGGNQQKVLFGKWLLVNPRVLLLEEPTRGVDVGAKIEIYRHIDRLTADGVAVVLVSSDLPELVEISDRVVVIRDGRMVTTLAGDQVSQHNVLTHALGGAQ
jgi:ABC-type sugar transport system ATPase subunit